MSKDIAIKVENVNKTFKLPHEKQSSIKGLFLNLFKGRRTYEKQQALKDISFEIEKGDFFGIVGRNGGGKSTLLKLLAGIYTPDSGSININGRLTPFIELGVGFNPELTGRENVFLNGALLGFNRKEMSAMYDEIVEFAELENFMDQKLKNYSSGMHVRLAFSIAIRANTEILLLDEVLAVGDSNFQRKCFNYFEELKRKGTTVVLVTHDMSSVVNYCNKALFLNKGEIKQIGSSADVATQYHEANIVDQGKNESTVFNNKDYKILDVSLRDNMNHQTNAILPNKTYKIIIRTKNLIETTDSIGVGFTIKNSGGVPVVGYNSYFDNRESSSTLSGLGEHIIEFEFKNILKNGTYNISVGIHRDIAPDKSSYHLEPLTVLDGAVSLVSQGWLPPGVLVHINSKARIKK